MMPWLFRPPFFGLGRSSDFSGPVLARVRAVREVGHHPGPAARGSRLVLLDAHDGSPFSAFSYQSETSVVRSVSSPTLSTDN